MAVRRNPRAGVAGQGRRLLQKASDAPTGLGVDPGCAAKWQAGRGRKTAVGCTLAKGCKLVAELGLVEWWAAPAPGALVRVR